ncbi:hypothetical protein [Roseobacter sp.]|uniref:MotE family protein n=1 Tax=Roseobacter sp. TaxID=1907202 RepID=UPI003297664E
MKKFAFLTGRSGRGSILLISGLLVGSAVLRIAIGAGQAVATENPTAMIEPTEPLTAQVAQPAPEEGREQLSKMLKSFQEREARLAKKENEIDMRMKALSVADQEIERRLANLKDAEDTLRGLMALANTAAEDDLVRLTAVYENMKPKDASALFEQMEPGFAAGFLGRMRADAAAGILSGLSPQVAYSISVILAGRNADIPEG